MAIESENPFGIIKPISFAASMLTSSTATEADPSAWSGATAYAGGAIVSLAATQLCYICLIANTNYSPDANVLGETPKWAVSNTEALAWNSGTAYIVGGRARLASTHKVYECVLAHTNAQPDLNIAGDTPKWILVGSTNKYACFDEKWGTQTVALNTLTIEITPGEVVDSMALLNMLGATVNVTCLLGADEIYNRTITLQTDIGVFDWKTYFLAPIVAQDDAVFTGLLPYYLQLIRITITGPAAVAIGGISMGAYIQFGVLKASPSPGITDYSQKTPGRYGDISVVEGAYAKRFSGTILIESTFVDQCVAILAQIRATPVVWIGAGNLYSSLIVWGFYKTFEVDIAYPDYSFCTLTVEGLV